MNTWPPTLADLKKDLKIATTDTLDDERLTTDLDAAIAWVEDVVTRYRYHVEVGETDPVILAKPAPTADTWLGTIRYAARLNARRRSQDGMVKMGEMGSSRVTSYDNDIDRLLKIGRFRPMDEAFA